MYNSIYPAYARTYFGINNRPIQRKTDDEKPPQSSQNADNNKQEEKNFSQKNSKSYFPNGEKVAIDYTTRKINIDQVLSDFKNTANAIGAPDDIKEEVSSYLDLISNQTKKNIPNQQIIQSNLKNASQILDEYITNTLKKPSKVVENWVDTLFLQQIDYKSSKIVEQKLNKTQTEELALDIQPEILPQNKEITLEPVQEVQEIAQESNINPEFYIPADSQLKRMFINAKKYVAINDSEKALESFQNTLDYAQEIGDTQTIAMVYFEQGCIYDGIDEVENALYNYNIAAQQSPDNNIKAKAHIQMSKIYDDYVKFNPAFDHLCAAVSFAGEADNLKLQSHALSNLAKIHAERYDKPNSFMFMELSDTIADSSNDKKTIGIIASKNGKTCEKLNENSKALKYYTTSAKSFYDIEDNESLAKKYISAADIMMKYGNKAKAKTLLSKAYIAAANTENAQLRIEISDKITSI